MFWRLNSPTHRRRQPSSISLLCNEIKLCHRAGTPHKDGQSSPQSRSTRHVDPVRLPRREAVNFYSERVLPVRPAPRSSVETPARLHVCGSRRRSHKPGLHRGLETLRATFCPVCLQTPERMNQSWVSGENETQKASPSPRRHALEMEDVGTG